MSTAGLSRHEVGSLDNDTVMALVTLGAAQSLRRLWFHYTDPDRCDVLPKTPSCRKTYIGRLTLNEGKPVFAYDVMRDGAVCSQHVELRAQDQVFAFGDGIAFQMNETLLALPFEQMRDVRSRAFSLFGLCEKNAAVTFVPTPDLSRGVVSWGKPLDLAVSL